MSNTSKNKAGTLYLVPAPLDFGCDSQTALTEVLPEGTLRRAASLTNWISENAKTARAYLKRIDALFPLAATLQAQNIVELPREAHKKGDHGNKGAAVFDPKPLLAAALAGEDMGLISEAGMPAVADPGSSIVRAAHDLGIRVVPLIGPVSLLLGLAASGLNGQNFAFVGYVPQDGAERTARLKELESLALRHGQTQQFIETPYRNAAMAQALLASLHPDTWLSISCGLTLEGGSTRTQRVAKWRAVPPALPSDVPAVFAFLA